MLSPHLLPLLRCPVTGSGLELVGNRLVSEHGTEYPVVQGVPVLLPPNDDPTLWVARASYDAAREERPDDDRYEDTIGITPEELVELRNRLSQPLDRDAQVDPLISFLIIATCGIMYRERIGKLTDVPIPDIRLPPGQGLLLDIGCNWGRWSVAASRRGYRVVGLDPSLGGVLAAKRLCQRLGVEADFVVADALRMPFAEESFDVIFSYSVLQHFAYAAAEQAVAESTRVAKPGALLKIQMANTYGIRCLYHQARRGFREPTMFEVRYYSPSRLRRVFSRFGTPRLEVDGFFGLGIQPSDRHLLPPAKRLVIDASEICRKTAGVLPPLKGLADSLYVVARRSTSS